MAGYRVPHPERPHIERHARRQTLVARVVGFVLMWGIVGVVALTANRAIPREHLPWKTLALVDPIGLATKTKAARSGEDPAACRAILNRGGIEFAEVAPKVSGFCDVHDALNVRSGLAPLSPAEAPMTCKQALAVSIWERQGCRPRPSTPSDRAWSASITTAPTPAARCTARRTPRSANTPAPTPWTSPPFGWRTARWSPWPMTGATPGPRASSCARSAMGPARCS